MAALAFGLAALVGGIRALDAQISTLGDEILSATVEPATLSASSEGPQMGLPPHTALMVEQIPKRLARAQTHRFFAVSVTAYTSEASQTDDSPSLTATRRTARPGTIALSRDLLRNFTPGAPFAFGDCVLIPGMGIYAVEDTMHPRWTHKADIWFSDSRTARRWGVRDVYLTGVEAEEPLLTTTDWHR